MKKVTAVVVTYNRLEMLKKTIEFLSCQEYHCDIIVINNASTDETENWLREYTENSDSVSYYNTGKNIGGAGGFNFGMKKAVENGCEYVWIMDDDCMTHKDTLKELMKADAVLGENYGYLSSVVLWTDGTECKMNRQKIKKSYYEYSHLLSEGLIQVEQSTFVSLLFPVRTLKKVGLPITDFFIWGDDIEFTRRITVRNSMPSFMVTSSKVTHAMKANSGSSIATDEAERIDRYRYAFRNEGYLYRKEGLKGVCYYIAKCALNFLRILTKAKDNRLKRCRVLIASMFRGLFFNPKTEFIQE